jgi:Glyoxalase-like domain
LPLLLVTSVLGTIGHAQDNRYLAQVDHLLYATPDLDLGIATIENLLGVRAAIGGQHLGFGTRNALIALGPSIYFEIIGPDPAQPKPAGPRRFGVDDLKEPKLIGWVSSATHLDALVVSARAQGIALGDALSGSRKRPDGTELTFGYTDPSAVIEHRLIPYFMDWGTSPHPATTSPQGARLVALRAEHPDPARIQRMLRVLSLDLPVTRGTQPMLIATIEGRKGRVELRGAQ